MRSGFVYILRNPGLTAYKVGMTTRPLYLRPRELAREYGTVYPFEIASRHAVDDPAGVEALAHRILARHRVHRSELFACSLEECVKAVHAAAVLILERPLHIRLWHSLTFPRPRPARRRGYSRRESGGAAVAAVLVIAFLFYVLADYLPAVPHEGFIISRLALALHGLRR